MTTLSHVQLVRRAGPADMPQIRTVLARSLADDPLIRLAVPENAPQRHSRVALFFMTQVERCVLFGHTDVALINNEIVGAALWLLPDIPRTSTLPLPKDLAQIRWEASLQELSTRLAAARHGNQECAGPYLAVLGVTDSCRHRGIGQQLLDAGHAIFGGQTTWLESANPANLSLYRRMGYKIIHQAPFGDSTLSQLIRS